MGTYTETGPTDSILEATQPAVAPGSDRLQGTGQQSVNQAQGGAWLNVYYHEDMGWLIDEYLTYEDAREAWVWNGGYVCKNLTPA